MASHSEETFLGNRLEIDPSAWIAPNAVLVGQVSVAADASVWYGAVVRGDMEPVRIGRASNIQDLTIVHVDRGLPVEVGERVSIGHRSIVHACAIEDDALIGMGAVLLNGCRIGPGAVVTAGAVVREGFVVPAGTVAAGVPATLRGPVDEGLRERAVDAARTYVAMSRGYRGRVLGGGPHGGEGSCAS
jgi:carbonic anhydrase/acetyltransferase-like protein (isoleucine patch superfamily)